MSLMAFLLCATPLVFAAQPSRPCVGAIGDRVFADTNLNGRQDTGEPGVNGVTLRLLDESGTVLASTRSLRVSRGQFRDPGSLNRGGGSTSPSGIGQGPVDGAYLFTGLCGGTYTIEVESPEGSEVGTTCSHGLARGEDAGCAPATVTLPDRGLPIRTVDFGLVPGCRGAIGDRVFFDANANGRLDAGENGFDGAEVTLRDASGAVIGMVLSGDCENGRRGAYRFGGLCAGSYTVEVLPPVGRRLATPCVADAGVDGNTDCPSAAVTLATDASVEASIDFAVVGTDPACAGSIGDRVWDDRNADGLLTEGEPGLNAALVALKDAVGRTVGFTCSGQSPGGMAGSYTFEGLCAGDYRVEIDAPAGFEPTVSRSRDPGAAGDRRCARAAVHLATGDDHDDGVDFGVQRIEAGAAPGSGVGR